MTAPREATRVAFHDMAPQIADDGGARTWLVRGGNFVVAVSEVSEGAALARADNADEYMVLVPPGLSATIEAGGETIEAEGDTLTIVPPGRSSVTAKGTGQVARIFSARADDLAAKACNAAAYADGAPELAPLEAWPDPVGGLRLRNYRLAEYIDPSGPRMQPRVFRSTNLMVNPFPIWTTRRDPKGLSPHSHADFEQASLTMMGRFIHHLRYPWTPNLEEWRPDEHVEIGSPSVTIMPATVIHTTRDIGDGETWLIDIFAPPRLDFSQKPGFVANEDEYPLPEKAREMVAEGPQGHLQDWQKARA